MKQQPHDNWAPYYDFVYERTYGNFYKQFTDVTIKVIKDILDDTREIFDYGAGTGRLTIPLKQQGYTVTAIEKSQPMADIIKRKAEALNLSIDIHSCDIADFRNGKADLAIALFTVLSYATTEEQINTLISNIKNHLHSGGYFFFDLPQAIFFQQRILADINKDDFKRRISLTPIDNDIYEYSEVCSGIFNGNTFEYSDSFQIRYWDTNFIENILVSHGFKNIKHNFDQFANTGSTYKLYQLHDNSTKA
jgi:SAM-dependent methyltransferase